MTEETQIRYKLLNQNLQSYNKYQWILNEWKETSGDGQLCSNGWLHCYTNLLLAILLNPMHASIKNPLLFKCEVKGKHLEDRGLKEGWTNMRIVEQLEVPNVTIIQKVAFGILCSLEVRKECSYVLWANNWLNNVDRTKESALSAGSYAANAAYYAANNHADAAYYAANNHAAYTGYSVTYGSATGSANAAYYATQYIDINLIELANKAMQYT